MNNSEIISLLRRSIKQFAPEARSIVFGSRARGDNRPDSDVDLLVILPDSYEGKEYVRRSGEISEFLYDLSLKNDIDIQPIITVEKIYHKRKTPFTVNIANEGIEL